ncbi:MAG: hypothetical protein L6V93_11900 [Clostridiales bacterium]|nr:MAG: hypothetical protein L6V93_11900 [Clostridiales bacterium]
MEKASGVKIEKFADLEKGNFKPYGSFCKNGKQNFRPRGKLLFRLKKASEGELDEILAKALNGGEISSDDEEKNTKPHFFDFLCARICKTRLGSSATPCCA